MIYTILTVDDQTISFDCVTSATQTSSVVVTEHPVETQAPITDHIYLENDTFQIVGVISDFNFYNPVKGEYGGSVYFGSDGSIVAQRGSGDVQQNIKDALLTIHKDRQVITILSGSKPNEKLEQFDNYIIRQITFTDNSDNGKALNVSMECVQITKVSVVTEYNSKLPEVLTRENTNKGTADPVITPEVTAEADAAKEKLKAEGGLGASLAESTYDALSGDLERLQAIKDAVGLKEAELEKTKAGIK